jgi:hypothetical protein
LHGWLRVLSVRVGISLLQHESAELLSRRIRDDLLSRDVSGVRPGERQRRDLLPSRQSALSERREHWLLPSRLPLCRR